MRTRRFCRTDILPSVPYEETTAFRDESNSDTGTTTAFLGVGGDGGEFLFQPRAGAGLGVNGTVGLDAFNATVEGRRPAPNIRGAATALLFEADLRLGGETGRGRRRRQPIVGRRDIDRITLNRRPLRVGDFSTAKPMPRTRGADFMNWAMWSVGGLRFSGRLRRGYTRGAVVELNRKGLGGARRLFQGAKPHKTGRAVSRPAAGARRIRRAPTDLR